MVISWCSGSVIIKLCVFQGHPEGCGLSALRWHGRVVPAAHGWHLEPLQVLQQHSAGGNGPGTWGPKDRVVQPLCTPPFLRSHRGQLWCDADESHEDPGRCVQSKVENMSAQRSFEVWSEPLCPEVSLPDAGCSLWVGCDWGSLIATFTSQTGALRRTQFSRPSGSWAAGWLRLGAEMQMFPCWDDVFSFFSESEVQLCSRLQLNNVGISEQHDPCSPVLGGSATSTLPEVQEPHHLGRPGPPQHHIPRQPRYSPS